MRKITTHNVGTNDCREPLEIRTEDEIGAGGAHHRYEIRGYEGQSNASSEPWDSDSTVIVFQNGPVAEVGVNGITHEALLAIVADRLECFQAGPYACDENAQALFYTTAALVALKQRTAKRLARGVEGPSQK